MCGIAGIIGRPDLEAVQSMMDAMSTRGPDDYGIHVDSQVVLGHRRLSILDLSMAGHQPMSRAGGRLWIVYNGEIYNFKSLRRQLEGRGHRFDSRTDTEVILALYEEMGIECLAQLRGMFAFAIWDRREATPVLLLARDHFGIKPLVYATTPRGLEFASDLPGLVAGGGVPRRIDRTALAQYLMHGHVVFPRTMIEGVSMLPPAHSLTIRPGEAPRIRPYWRLDVERCEPLSRRETYGDQTARVRFLLEEAARSQMASDVPLGAFLSGGIDSAGIVALMTRAAGRPIHTFSIGFPQTGGALDESVDAELTARHLGAVHQAVQVSGTEVAKILPDIAVALGQPTVDGVNMYLVSSAARRDLTVALTGVGGDELFAGYPSFARLARYRHQLFRARQRIGWLKRLPGRRMFPGPGSINRPWTRLEKDRPLVSDYMACRMVRRPAQALRVAGDGKVDPEAFFAYVDSDEPGLADPVRRVTLLESRLYLAAQILRDTDAASMAHSLEIRVPLLDVDLAEYVYGLPQDAKLAPASTGAAPAGKRILIDALRDVLPEWTWRKPKRGFTLPFGEWLRGPMRGLVDDILIDPGFRGDGLLDEIEVQREWRTFLAGQGTHWSVVWTTLMLKLWWYDALRRRSSTPAPAARNVESPKLT